MAPSGGLMMAENSATSNMPRFEIEKVAPDSSWAFSFRARVRSATIAVPTELHGDIALPFLRAGTPALVEKPMARTLGEADAMIAAAALSKAPLAVGHTERFNPAVVAALGVSGNLRADSLYWKGGTNDLTSNNYFGTAGGDGATPAPSPRPVFRSVTAGPGIVDVLERLAALVWIERRSANDGL